MFPRSLDRLRTASRVRTCSAAPGRRLGTARGRSTDFADYRKYDPGDDLRYVDWSIYKRTGKLFSRQFRAEADLDLHILLDTSRSMRFGVPDKLDYAKKLALALAYVGLNGMDRVALATFGSKLRSAVSPERGGQQLYKLQRLLDEAGAEGDSDFDAALEGYAARAERGGFVIVVSDFFSPQGCEQGLRRLAQGKLELALVHVLAPREVRPDFGSDVALEDIEAPAGTRMPLDVRALERYRENLENYLEKLESLCLENGSKYVRIETSTPFEGAVRQLLLSGVWEIR